MKRLVSTDIDNPCLDGGQVVSDVPRVIYGTMRRADGTTVAALDLVITRIYRGTQTQGLSLVPNTAIMVTTDINGLLNTALMAGQYAVSYTLDGEGTVFRICVPDQEGPHDITTLIDRVPVNVSNLDAFEEVANQAHMWASAPVDLQLPDGLYSARHYQIKTAELEAINQTLVTQVSNDADSAAASELAAGISETNAGASATAASASEISASTSEANAAASETNAAASQTAAATSASSASTSATNAQESENQAEIYKTQALSAYQGRQYGTRAEFVADTAYVSGVEIPVFGTVVTAGREKYRRIGIGVNPISDLPNWEPFNVVTPQHFGALGNGSADDTAAFTAAIAMGKPVFVPYTPNFYKASFFNTAQAKMLYGPGVVQDLSGGIQQISSTPFVDNNNARVRVINNEIVTTPWPGIATGNGSLYEGVLSARTTRTGGVGQYGNILSSYLVTADIPIDEFDVGITSWVSSQSVSSGEVFGSWIGANTPDSSRTGDSWTGVRSVYAVQLNVGNRWGDTGLQNDIGLGRRTVGLQIGADVVPSPDGTTGPRYDATFGLVVTKSSQGQKWHTGYLSGMDAIVPNGRALNIRGGSIQANQPSALLRADSYFFRGVDFSEANISDAAIRLAPSHKINWDGGSIISGSNTGLNLTTGAGTGAGILYADNFSQVAARWSSNGSAPLVGFLGAPAVSRRTVTGSRGGNAALASLLTALDELGLITNNTTA